MPLEFRCQCGQLLRVPDTSVGKNARCPKCQALMLVPASALSAGEAPMAANPFGETGAAPPAKSLPGSAAESINPYASPAAATAYPQGLGPAASQRPGLPWEVKRQDFSSWWETARLVMSNPPQAFSDMRLEGGLGQPMMFALWGLGIGFLAQLVWQLPFSMLPLMLGQQVSQEEILVQLTSSVVGGAIGVVLGATVGILINAAITHVMLILLGGPNRGYEPTLRVMGYAQGAVAWTNIVPLAGPVIAAIWGIILAISGLARAHDISTGKAALAVVVPLGFCFLGFVALVAGLVWLALSVSPV